MFHHKTKTGLNSSFVERSACPAGEGWQITQCRRNLKGLRVGGRGIYAWPLLFSKVGRAASVAFDGRRPSCLENLRAAGHKISKNT